MKDTFEVDVNSCGRYIITHKKFLCKGLNEHREIVYEQKEKEYLAGDISEVKIIIDLLSKGVEIKNI